MKNFNKINNIVGWVIFAIATLVYVITAEETASFWDCGEFIAVSYKLMVPHPPGAPFFLLMGRFFSMFAPSPDLVAYSINMLSALASSFSILFLFWSIVLFAKKFVKPEGESGEFTMSQAVSLLGAGAVGALAYTFSDSFWFSASEAEVYGLSSFFTAFVIWATLKWDAIDDPRRANKWLLILAYAMGLSIGVHLLNLTTIPALALVYYFKKNKEATPLGVMMALLVGLVIVGVIMVGVIPGLPSMAGAFEIFFVNTLGLPFNSGFIFFSLAFIGALTYAIIYSQRERKELLNTALLAFTFILIGYATYGIVPIRSQANPPIDENDPENLISFVSYLKREQYGDRPLVFGPHFMAERDGDAEEARRRDGYKGSPMYRKGKDSYEIYDYRQDVIYQKKDKMLFPRMYSTQPGHDGLYREWTSLAEGERPGFGDNLGYMLRYQFGHMYFRYFMWNFAGRDGDNKEAGWLLPWETNSEDLPHDLRTNKSRSNFFMIPLILGLIGLFYHWKQDEKRFWVNMLLFFIMGLGLVLYLNSPPTEPRERDYIYVGSFYAFAIWIGMSVLAITDFFKTFQSKSVLAPIIAIIIGMTAPTLMAVNGWDNHNRSNRFHSVDQARNTLASCAPNAVLFTGGDNDTFPLWYVQEVEGFRTDVRVVVLSYFSTDWYIKQMSRKVHESEALSLSIDLNQYRQGTNDIVYLRKSTENAMNVKAYLKLVNNDDPSVKLMGKYTSMPTDKLFLDVDSAKVANMDFIPIDRKAQVPNRMYFSLKPGKTYILKSDLAILDLMATSNWERPIYFNNTSNNSSAIDLQDFLQVEGMAFRLMPYRMKNTDSEVGEVNTAVMAENMSKFQFRGFDDPDVFHDEEYRKFGANTRNAFFRLAAAQFKEGNKEEAIKTLDEALEKIPDESIPYSYFAPRIADLYFRMGEEDKAKKLSEIVGERSIEAVDYLFDYKNTAAYGISKRKGYDYMEQKALMILQQLRSIYRNQEQIASREIASLKARQATGDETVSASLQKAQENQKYYQENAKKYEESFSKLYNRR